MEERKIIEVLQDWFYNCSTKEQVKDLLMTLQHNIEIISDCRYDELND